MITLTMNNREIKAERDDTILEVARKNNIYIPTLCENEGVAPYGACRLCLGVGQSPCLKDHMSQPGNR